MKITKITLVCAFVIAMSASSFKTQTNPFLYAQIEGPTTIGHYSVGCYDLPNVAGATYQWKNEDTNLRLFCGSGTTSHAGFTSPYNQTANCFLKWVTIYNISPLTGDTITVSGWFTDPECNLYAQFPPLDESGYISCDVTYNGQTYYFYKKVFIVGYEEEFDEFDEFDEFY